MNIENILTIGIPVSAIILTTVITVKYFRLKSKYQEVKESAEQVEELKSELKIAEALLDNSLDMSVHTTYCPCGQEIKGHVFINEDNKILCPNCNTINRVNCELFTTIVSEPANVSNIFEVLKDVKKTEM